MWSFSLTMCRLLKHIVWLVLVSVSSCTDLLAVYKHDILLVRDVDKIRPSEPLSWKPHVLDLPKPLSYPVGLTHDPETNRLFVAEASPHEAKIFAVSLDSQYRVDSMVAAVKNIHTMVEGMSYDPRSKQLFWAEPDTHSIKKATISKKLAEELAAEPELLHNLGNVVEPRGLAVDPCNEWLYWSERGAGGMTPSSVEMCDLRGNQHKILSEIRKENEYYQGLTFDFERGSLVLGLTVGDDESTSSCRLVNQSLVGGEPQDLLELDSCYPFALTVEQNYLYWADWGRGGIMRAHASNPDSVVKLVHTPVSTSDHGRHQGAFGLVLINTPHTSLPDACTEKADVPSPIKMAEPEKTTIEKSEMAAVKPDYKAVKEEEPAQSISDEVDKGEEEEQDNVQGGEASSSESDKEHVSKHKSSEEKMSDPSVSSSQETAGNEDSSIRDDHETYPGLSHMQLHSSNHSFQYGNAKNSAQTCHEKRLILVIAMLCGLCVLFLATTVALLMKLFCHRQYKGCRPILPSVVDGTQASHTHPRHVKRFGPKKHFGSGGRAKMAGMSTCSGQSNDGDGVSINIEDCCQMTLCETPCYTSVKKEGKTYRGSSRGTNRCEDKRGLLDNCDEI